MRVVERTRDFAGNAHGVGDGQLLLALEARPQRFAGHEGMT
jgi:hypothetical protein